MMSKEAEVRQETLALMVLKTLEMLGRLHGSGISCRIEQTSGGRLSPQLRFLKLEQEGYIASKWGLSENSRKAKYYRLTRAGRKRLDAAAKEWALTIDILARFLSPEQSS